MRRIWLLAIFIPLFCAAESAPALSGLPLTREAYVWQRTHTEAVGTAVRTHAASLDGMTVLAAEISWKKFPAGFAPQITRASLDWSALHAVKRLGLALRINAYPGPFRKDDATIDTLTALARELLADAAIHDATITELQVDFDAATAKLAGYQLWLEALRDAVAPVPLTFTALPAWLGSPGFSPLAHAVHGYVLQVHSLARPGTVDQPFTLCDPVAARAAVAQAALVNVPFRVALPTYGYALAFDSAGKFAGLSAAGPRSGWQDRLVIRELRADPAELAALVHSLVAAHPAVLTGFIWYRLPVTGDQLNWSWTALASVMAGRSPAPHLRVVPELRDDGHFDLTLVNDGDGDFNDAVRVAARWSDARRTGADAMGTFSITAEDRDSIHLAAPHCAMPAGTRRVIGWLRLSLATLPPHVSLEN